MHDPTRIPQLMAAFQDAWEGQPDLTLPAFIGMLTQRGMSWSTSEEELLLILQELNSTHPALIDVPPVAPPLLITDHPRMAVTLTNGCVRLGEGTSPLVIARSGEDPQRMPAVWRYSSLRPAGPGRPLVVADTEGVEHRLGVVEMATSYRDHGRGELGGLLQSDIGTHRWLLLFEDGTRGLLGPRLRLWSTVGRETALKTLAWAGLIRCEPGCEMVVAPAGGGKPLRLGLLSAVILLEA